MLTSEWPRIERRGTASPHNARKNEAAHPVVGPLAIELVCVLQGEHRVREGLRQQNCYDAEQNLIRVGRMPELRQNRGETGEGCSGGKHQKTMARGCGLPSRSIAVTGKP
jgi:hypothetical protein